AAIASGRRRTAERPAASVAKSASGSFPPGATAPSPVTATRRTAAQARSAARDEPVDVVGDLAERRERRRIGVLDRDVIALLEREQDFHRRERVEVDLLERRLARQPLARQLVVLHQDLAEVFEHGRRHLGPSQLSNENDPRPRSSARTLPPTRAQS